MDTFAVIKTGGKQYKVTEGETLNVEKLAVGKDKITFEEILLTSQDGKIQLGTPFVSGAKVAAKIVDSVVKDKKIKVVKFKSKSKYLKTKGHRQQKTRILIEKIYA